MKETEIQRQIIDYLFQEGYLPFRMPIDGVRVGNGARRKNPLAGFPDLLVFDKDRLGRVFGVEVKKPKGKLQDNQKDMHKLLDAWGVECFVVTSVEDVIEKLG